MARLDQTLTSSAVFQLLVYALGDAEAIDLISNVDVSAPLLVSAAKGHVDRSIVAQAVALIQFHDFLRRAPTARNFLVEVKPASVRIALERCDLYTVSGQACGEYGDVAHMIPRILTSLGFVVDWEGWGGDAGFRICRYRHADYPDDVPKMIVHDIQLDRLPSHIREPLAGVTVPSVNPLAQAVSASAQLGELEHGKPLNFHDASDLVLKIARCFERLHGIPRLDAYQAIASHSKGISWFATEGHALRKVIVRLSQFCEVSQWLGQAGIPAFRTHCATSAEQVTEISLLGDPLQRRFEGATGSFVEYSVDGPCLAFSR
ncbi:DUF1338 family protein [Pandoraea anhela]|uniref:IQ calmodulin-binding motif-containing protein n=1 Tax=Pandoraea anhela TaxID=2508295 RepID=A0A5E4WJ13_9BURK|nr:DUF1338 family protein [Pandoraea anhela]VVE23056.1 IQ calmodulin-binding motif-containing protein [Pandoraea anhela]